MNYRESFAYALGWGAGYDACKEYFKLKEMEK